jgi:hypothetical protein
VRAKQVEQEIDALEGGDPHRDSVEKFPEGALGADPSEPQRGASRE